MIEKQKILAIDKEINVMACIAKLLTLTGKKVL